MKEIGKKAKGPKGEIRKCRQNSFPFSPLRFFAISPFVCLWLILAFPAFGADEWARVTAPRKWTFPRDFGAHPEYRTEWWYFTGKLKDDGGNRYGYQLTFFRQGVRFHLPSAPNAWDIRDIYLAHFAVSDVSRGRFQAADRLSRVGPGLAGAGLDGMDVWLLNWSARMIGSVIRLEARASDKELRLELSPRKPPVIHGEKGFSRKGPSEGQASYYVSFTDLETRGSLKLPGSPSPLEVRGVSWFDQEFGSNQLTPEQKGWDWFSLHLSDGRDLMIYFLRLQDGSVEPASSGTLVAADGSSRHLKLSDLTVTVLDRWKSPRSKGEYPSRWRIQVPSAKIDLTIAPLLADQELQTEASTGITYWEGAVAGKGLAGPSEVTCEGYVELTGYAGALGGIF
ncbi:MAG: carotenoid 1,2-hydratase [Syntrophaceae bacterium]|nr:carotenoid 1,2-hydratase [Syntrophaceae bacterium]